VGSLALARKYRLPISPATIRNEMAQLEQEGYVTHPYTSAGRIPSDKGYRYYVGSLMEEEELSEEEQRTLRHQFHQAARELEEWLRLAAAALARLVCNLALVTNPQGPPQRLRHVHLVLLQDFLALLILVLQRARLRQQLLPLPEPVTQAELDIVANKLNHLFAGLSAAEIRRRSWELSPLEEQATRAMLALMDEEEGWGQPYLQGLRHVLSQPEFAHSSAKALHILEALDEHHIAQTIPLDSIAEEWVTVILGSENRQDTLRDCSIIAARYGLPEEISGVLAVLGPTRMRYSRTIAAIRYMASLMTELITTYWG